MERNRKLGLCLSGGGFRATIYHLGVIASLRDFGMLPALTTVTAVSGGSVLAAHLATEWDRYNGSDEEFASAADELLTVVTRDLRGRIVRRWLIGTLLIVPRLLGFLSLHRLMIDELVRLYGKSTIQALAARNDKPNFHILATSITTGQLCKFTDSSFSIVPDLGDEISTSCSEVPLSVAVAASAAFPPMFPPVPISASTLNTDQIHFPYTHYLTDGGIYDNLGLHELWRLSDPNRCEALIVSDAGANFDWSIGKKYRELVSRNIRSTDILMDRVSKLVPSQLIGRGTPLIHIFVGKELAPADCIWHQSPETQKAVRNTRTDLDKFSPKEIIAIARHGYSVAVAALLQSDLVDKQPATSWARIDGSDRVVLADLRNTARRKLRIVAWKDWSFYVLIALLASWFWLLPGPSNTLKDVLMEAFNIRVPVEVDIANMNSNPFRGQAMLMTGAGPFNHHIDHVDLDAKGNVHLTSRVPYNGEFIVAVEPPNTALTVLPGSSSHLLVLRVYRGRLQRYEDFDNIEFLYSRLKLEKANGLSLRIAYDSASFSK
jgi:predicted acylesterase/phospholipase RssA